GRPGATRRTRSDRSPGPGDAMSRALPVVVLLLAACSAGTTSSSTTAPIERPSTPEAVLEELVEAVSSGDDAAAAAVTDPSHVPLVALAEGVAGRQVAALSEVGRAAVAANFWQVFAE